MIKSSHLTICLNTASQQRVRVIFSNVLAQNPTAETFGTDPDYPNQTKHYRHKKAAWLAACLRL